MVYSLCTPRNQFSPLGRSRYELKAGGRGCVWHPLLESHEGFVGICLALCGLGRGCRIRIVGTIPLSQTPVQLMEEKTTGKVGLLPHCPELPPMPGVLLEEGDRDGSHRLCRKCRLFWGPSRLQRHRSEVLLLVAGLAPLQAVSWSCQPGFGLPRKPKG